MSRLQRQLQHVQLIIASLTDFTLPDPCALRREIYGASSIIAISRMGRGLGGIDIRILHWKGIGITAIIRGPM